MATQDTIAQIQKATRFLASVCDGATSWDGRGFNKIDSSFGKSLAKQERWTPKQVLAMRKVLIKYRGQLEAAGFDTEVIFKGELDFDAQPQTPATKKAAGKKATIHGDRIRIDFPFDWDTVALVKSIPGKKFHANAYPKYWTAPISIETAEILSKGGFELAPEIEILLKKPPKVEELDLTEPLKLKRELFDFQKKGVAFIESRNGRALIGDEMGLGKTIQALAWLGLHPEKRPAIIVCPAHLKLNWAQEVRMTLPGNPNIQVLQGTDTTQPLTGDIIIVNYDILSNKYDGKKEIPYTGWVDFILDRKPQVLIVDEAHYCKSPKALRTKATRKLASKVKHVIALTGTPIVNRPVEGFTIIQMVDKSLFPNFFAYAKRYCGARHNGFGWDFTGATNKEELHEKLKTIMIRRKKDEVLPELPDKLFSYVPMEIENEEEYAQAERDFIHYLRKIKGEEAAEKAGKAEHLVKIEAMKQLAIRGKMKAAIQWIRDFLDTNGNKLVVFAIHKETIDRLMKEFGKEAVKVDGGVTAIKRDEAVKAFQNDPAIKLFVGNIKAAGTGLTLTAASSVAFLELPWTPGELKQAEDRCHRIGQKNTVNVYYLLADQTIEGTIAKILDEKRVVLDAVLDGKEVEEGTLLSELINAYLEKGGAQ
jgi:SWI/SNF-related matrix-associated actin-dependent regulator 1 of chromatin subfamily A